MNPIRPHRVEPRVKQRRPKSFPLMITPRQARRQQGLQPALGGSLHAIRLLAAFGDQGWRAQFILQHIQRDHAKKTFS